MKNAHIAPVTKIDIIYIKVYLGFFFNIMSASGFNTQVHFVYSVMQFMMNINNILLVANLAEGNCVSSSSIRPEYDFAN